MTLSAGMMQNSVRQQDVGQAPWFGMTAAHQSPSAAGMVHHYHNQSPISATVPTTASPASAAAPSFYHNQQQANAVASSTAPSAAPANQIVRSTPEQISVQQHHHNLQQHHLLNELAQHVGAVGQSPQLMSCGVGHDSASIVTSLAGSSVMTSGSLDSSMNFVNLINLFFINFCKFLVFFCFQISRASLPFCSERIVQHDRFSGGASQLNSSSTYQSVQSQTDVRRQHAMTSSSPANQKPNNFVGGINRNTATGQESASNNSYGQSVAFTSSDASPSPVVVSTSNSSRQQRDTVVVETPVRTLADTSTMASTDFEGVTARLSSDHTQRPSGTTPTEDKKVECDSSVPSPPEGKI